MVGGKSNKKGAADYEVCGRCCKDVKTDEKAVGCEICGAWFHATCKGMPVEVYKFMVEDEAGEQLQWY